MTVIAGFIDRGVAYIGADSCVSYGENHRVVQSGRKLLIKGHYLFGLSGNVRFEQIIRSAFEPPVWQARDDDPNGERLYDFLVSEFAPALLSCVKEFPGQLNQTDGQTSGQFLLSTHGYIFEVDNDFTVCRPDDGLFAVGSGNRVALGALHAISRYGFHPPETRMNAALRAAAHYDKSCAPPFFYGCTNHSLSPVIQPLAFI